LLLRHSSATPFPLCSRCFAAASLALPRLGLVEALFHLREFRLQTSQLSTAALTIAAAARAHWHGDGRGPLGWMVASQQPRSRGDA
jgi:hypothetical protein